MEFEAINVVVESLPDEKVSETHTKTGGYEITAAGEDGTVRTFSAGALNLNGYAFATSSMEIGEYNRLVTVEQKDGSRYVNLKTEEAN
jgi:hypothetical protein